MTKKDFLDISLISENNIKEILKLSHCIKSDKEKYSTALKGKTLVNIFEKKSTRTRISFEVGIQQLGGYSVVITSENSQLSKGETIEDTSKVISRFGDIIMARVNKHSTLETLAKNSSIPVINGLSDYSHPCQIIADIMTYEEKLGDIKGATIAWIGDGNNVLHSWIHIAEKLKFNLNIACPENLKPCDKTVQDALNNGANIIIHNNPVNAVSGVNAVLTDTWISMGDKDVENRLKTLKPYQVTSQLMDKANKNAIFMHCLPAYRGNEVTSEVIDGSQSVVFDEAENRLHVQKAIMIWCAGKQNKI